MFTTLSSLFLTIISLLSFGRVHHVPACDTSKFDSSFSYVENFKDSVKIVYIDAQTNEKRESVIKHKNLCNKTYIIEFSAGGEYFLANNAANEKTDLIITAKTLETCDLGLSRCDVIGESPDKLYLTSFANKIETTLEFDKTSKTLKEIDKIKITPGLRFGEASHFRGSNRTIWSYFTDKETWLCEVTNGHFSKHKLADTAMKDVVILEENGTNLVMYKGYDATIAPFTFNPEMLSVKVSKDQASCEITARTKLDLGRAMSFDHAARLSFPLLAFSQGAYTKIYAYKDGRLELKGKFKSTSERNFNCKNGKAYTLEYGKVDEVQ